MSQRLKLSERSVKMSACFHGLQSPPELPRATIEFLGLPVAPLTLAEALSLCDQAICDRRRLLVGVLNAAKIVNLRNDAVLRNSLLECDVILADGQSVVWSCRLLGFPLPQRIPGIDLFFALLERGDLQGRSVFLLGARQEVLEKVEATVAKRWPGIRIVGSRNGYFGEDDEAALVREIRAVRPDMLFLGMTSPKKENFLARYGPELGVPVVHGVGGSFDILAGVTRRAPVPVQRLGMEWAYRVAQEPRRLGRRYFVTNRKFVALVARELVDGARRRTSKRG